MKKFIIGVGLFVAGVILENKFGVKETSTNLAKKGWKWVVKKTDVLQIKEDVKEYIDDLNKEVSE